MDFTEKKSYKSIEYNLFKLPQTAMCCNFSWFESMELKEEGYAFCIQI